MSAVRTHRRAELTAAHSDAHDRPRRSPALLACALLWLCAPQAQAQDFGLVWWTVDGGGELFMETADQEWQLSGTLAQWDATDSMGLVGGDFSVVGGFWPPADAPGSEIFRDGFED